MEEVADQVAFGAVDDHRGAACVGVGEHESGKQRGFPGSGRADDLQVLAGVGDGDADRAADPGVGDTQRFDVRSWGGDAGGWGGWRGRRPGSDRGRGRRWVLAVEEVMVPAQDGGRADSVGFLSEKCQLVGFSAVTTPESIDVPLENAAADPDAAVSVPEKMVGRGRVLVVVVAMASVLMGAAAATGVFLVTGRPEQPMYRYAVSVYFKADATAGQKAAVEAALRAFKATGEVKFVDREQAWKTFQKTFKTEPKILKYGNKEDLPESFNLETKGHFFDCAGYAKVRHMPGVDSIQVIQKRLNDYVAVITCDTEYASS